MGGYHSRKGSELSDSDREEDEEVREEGGVGEWSDRGAASLDESDPGLQVQDAVKLYLHIGGNTAAARWVISDKLATYAFFRSSSSDGSEEEETPPSSSSSPWFLRIGTNIRARVGAELRLRSFPDQRRFDFIADGVWSIKFGGPEGYREFQDQYERCLFENTYGFEANDDNRMKVFGKDFMAWAQPEAEEDSIWTVAEDGFETMPGRSATPNRVSQNLLREFEEEANEGGIQSLALGVLDNSFLVSDSGIQVLRNFSHGVHGKGVSVKISGDSAADAFSTPKKALLTRAETNMLLMSPNDSRVHQLDIETGKVVSEWKFEKDGTDITMRDIANDSKCAQLDPSESTFLGLDDNRLCRWDMRDRRGIAQSAANNAASDRSPVLDWAQGHKFSRGTNFRCFASAGDGSIVVGSLDGKIRLYSKNSMRMAKTVFPGLGSPITHVDVTFDGKWILGTTDTYLILVSTVFKDKDGKEKTGFEGRMRDKIAAPRLLKLTPVDSHQAGRNNKLHGGQFSWVTESGRQERHLVATVGKSSVYWNFQQVKESDHECYKNKEGLKSCYCYRIVLKDESIVQSRFMHEKFAVSDSPEAPLVVATPMRVTSFSISRGG